MIPMVPKKATIGPSLPVLVRYGSVPSREPAYGCISMVSHTRALTHEEQSCVLHALSHLAKRYACLADGREYAELAKRTARLLGIGTTVTVRHNSHDRPDNSSNR